MIRRAQSRSAPGREASLSTDADAFTLIAAGGEIGRLIFSRVVPPGADAWDVTDDALRAEFGALICALLDEWFALHGQLAAGAVSVLATWTHWVTNSGGHAAVGVMLDFVFATPPQVVPRTND